MRETADGYNRPVRSGPASQEQDILVDQVCPGINIIHAAEAPGITRHPTWGPVIDTKLGWSTDGELRRNASSGGGLSAVLLARMVWRSTRSDTCTWTSAIDVRTLAALAGTPWGPLTVSLRA